MSDILLISTNGTTKYITERESSLRLAKRGNEWRVCYCFSNKLKITLNLQKLQRHYFLRQI